MKKIMHRYIIGLAIAMAFILSFILCSCNQTTDSSQSSRPTPVRVALVTTVGGLGDKNFSSMVYEGLLQAQDIYGIDIDYTEPRTNADFQVALRHYAQVGNYDLIIALNFEQLDALLMVADEFPNQHYLILDPVVDHPSIHSIAVKRIEQTFLSGVFAGLATLSDMPYANPENTIGVVYAVDSPDLMEIVAGFEAGARFVNPEIVILKSVMGGFNNPGTGKEMALSLYAKGADFILHSGGSSGLGVYSAASEAKAYVIGMGANQNAILPDHIAATASRNVAEQILQEVSTIIDDTWHAGADMVGLADGAVGFTTAGSNVVIPDAILREIQAILQAIQTGELTLPVNATDLEPWLENHTWPPYDEDTP